ncbi:MAG: hypothetical protein OEW98_03365 [Betaproteobacteria bacterium]|jgi:hypothetical protein|nr:hypothetical protein [Betaproteobacteria bacterium]
MHRVRALGSHFAARKVDANLRGEHMQNGLMNVYPAPEARRKAERALVASGLWLRIGFIGACGVAVGLIQLINGGAKPVSALALALAGGVLAATSWRRAKTVLKSADDALPVAPSTRGGHALAGA